MDALREATGGVPGLAVVLVGARGDSETYVRSKVKACEEVGIQSYASYLEEGVTQEELLKVRREGGEGGAESFSHAFFWLRRAWGLFTEAPPQRGRVC